MADRKTALAMWASDLSQTTANTPWIKLADALDGTFAMAVLPLSLNSFSNIVGAATTTLKSGAGVLVAVVNNKAVALGVTTLYDNTAASGTKIGTITNPAALLASQFGLSYNLTFTTGLTVVTSSTDDITVIYR